MYDVLPTFFEHDEPWVSLGMSMILFSLSNCNSMLFSQLPLKYMFVARSGLTLFCQLTTKRMTAKRPML